MFTVRPHPFLQQTEQREAKRPLIPGDWADVIRGRTRNHRSGPMISHDRASAVQPMVSHRLRLREGWDEKLGGHHGIAWDRGTKPQPDRTGSSHILRSLAPPPPNHRDRIPPAQIRSALQRQQGRQQPPIRFGATRQRQDYIPK